MWSVWAEAEQHAGGSAGGGGGAEEEAGTAGGGALLSEERGSAEPVLTPAREGKELSGTGGAAGETEGEGEPSRRRKVNPTP